MISACAAMVLVACMTPKPATPPPEFVRARAVAPQAATVAASSQTTQVNAATSKPERDFVTRYSAEKFGEPFPKRRPTTNDEWWIMTDTEKQYDIVADTERDRELRGDVLIRNKGRDPIAGAGMVQYLAADDARGRRIVFTGQIRSSAPDAFALPWGNVFDRCSHFLRRDANTAGAVRGTTSWSSFRVELDVPADADYYALGLGVRATGEVRVKDLHFEIVSQPTSDVSASRPLPSTTNKCLSRKEVFAIPLIATWPGDLNFKEFVRGR